MLSRKRLLLFTREITMKRIAGCLLALVLLVLLAPARAENPPKGFVELFNGKDFTGWKVPEGDNGHWKIVDGIINYDTKREAKAPKHLWTPKSYKNVAF